MEFSRLAGRPDADPSFHAKESHARTGPNPTGSAGRLTGFGPAPEPADFGRHPWMDVDASAHPAPALVKVPRIGNEPLRARGD